MADAERDAVWWQGERHHRCDHCHRVLPDADMIVHTSAAILIEMGGRELDRRYRSHTSGEYCSLRCARVALGWERPASPTAGDM